MTSAVARSPSAAPLNEAYAPQPAWLRLRWLTQQHDVDGALAEAMRTVASRTRAGGSLQMAIAEAGSARGPVAAAMRRAAARLELGVPIERSMQALARDLDSQAAYLFADVVAMQHRRGGDLGELCHRLARLLHDRARLQREVRSATAQARFTARAVVALPAVVAAAWALLASDSFAGLFTPGMSIVITPAILSIVAGVLVVRVLARRALVLDAEVSPERGASLLDRGLTRIAGSGSQSAQRARTTAAAALPVACVLASGGVRLASVVCCVVALACALAWPALHARREREHLVAIADAGLPTLLELSIALLSAGATPLEVAAIAIERSPDPLRSHLAPALAQMRLGRSAASAISACPAVAASIALEVWVYALTNTAQHGQPLSQVLETLLVDARDAERERARTRAATTGPRMQLATVLLIVPGIMWLVLATTARGLLEQLSAAGIV